jgi:hypothetical protein
VEGSGGCAVERRRGLTWDMGQARVNWPLVLF